LREKLDNLRLTISDQNLELIPDYEQRLDVLRELRFIDENSTVLLKGRVACEVGPGADLLMMFGTLTACPAQFSVRFRDF
jgi:antiviral helicase SKI2